MQLQQIHKRLQKLGDRKRAEGSLRYFKTGPGEYGEGAQFLGISAPVLRQLSREYFTLPFPVLLQLLKSAFHEERALALLILVRRFSKGDSAVRKRIYNLYLKHTRYINNWDLVDVSAEPIVGAFLFGENSDVLFRLAHSASLWERRMAIMATFHFLKQGRFDGTFRIVRMLLEDEEDLIHKAAGWMLREVGKRNPEAERDFLKKNYKRMPRTMLRCAIEKFPEAERQKYLRGKI